MHKLMEMQEIESIKNPKLKRLLSLTKKREREKEKAFIVEGKKEILRALEAGYEMDSLFLVKAMPEFQDIKRSYQISEKIMESLSYRGLSQGCLAIFSYKEPESFTIKEGGFYLVIEDIEKPGNLGAILRTADGAGLDAVFITNSSVDLYNPNFIRASLGASFHFPVEKVELKDLAEKLKEKNIPLIATSPKAKKNYWEIDKKSSGVAWFLGSDKDGLSQEALSVAQDCVSIPMLGKVDSLNIAASAAILLYDTRRELSR